MNFATQLRQRANNSKEHTREKYAQLASKAFQSIKNDLIDAADAGRFYYEAHFDLVGGVDVGVSQVCEDFKEAFKHFMEGMGFYIDDDFAGCVFMIDWEEHVIIPSPPTSEYVNKPT